MHLYMYPTDSNAIFCAIAKFIDFLHCDKRGLCHADCTFRGCVVAAWQVCILRSTRLKLAFPTQVLITEALPRTLHSLEDALSIIQAENKKG